MTRFAALLIALGILLCRVPLRASHAASPVSPVNGGYADAGLVGEYFANPTFDGSPRFVRRDVRVDFDWGARSSGGSTEAPYRGFPAEDFSVRWTGRIFPRAAGEYTLAATSDDEMRVRLRPQGAAIWDNVVESRPDARLPVVRATGTYRFGQAGVPYDIQIEYRHRGVVNGERKPRAIARLAWTAPGIPVWETVDAATSFAVDVDTEAFADVVKAQANANAWRQLPDPRQPAACDASGNPTSDAGFRLWDGGLHREGTYHIRFQGKADLSVAPKDWARLSGLAYNSEKNITVALLTVLPLAKDERPGPLTLQFLNTQRTSTAARRSGIAGLHVMRPLMAGGDVPCADDTTFTPAYRAAASRFTTVRFPRTEKSVSWDDQIALANQTGKDLYLCLPETVSDHDVTQLAQRLRFGSDGTVPYQGEQAGAKIPPLNPNLKVYVECEAVRASRTTADASAANNRTALEQHVHRTRQISQLFRAVFGGTSTDSRVRMVLLLPNTSSSDSGSDLSYALGLPAHKDGKETAPSAREFLWGAGIIATAHSGDNVGVSGPLVPGGMTTFVQGVGVQTQSFTLPAQQTSSVYALRFRAVQRRQLDKLENDRESFDVSIDGKVVTEARAGSEGAFYHPDATAAYFETRTFSGEPGSTHTVSFVGRGPNGSGVKTAVDAAQIDDVQLLSVDAVFAKPSSAKAQNAEEQTRAATIVRQHGLHYVETGAIWQPGDDAVLTPIERAARRDDPRAITATLAAIDATTNAAGGGPGAALEIFGPRPPWTWPEDADKEPLPRAIDTANGRLPAESKEALQLTREGLATTAPFYDLVLTRQTPPAEPTDVEAPKADAPEGTALAPGQSLHWLIRLTQSERLRFLPASESEGLQLEVDGEAITGPEPAVYTQGTHMIRLRAVGDQSVEGVHGVRVVFTDLSGSQPASPPETR